MGIKVIFTLFLALVVSNVESHKVEITKFGAKPDGTDIKEALAQSWKEACESTIGGKVSIPPGKWYLSQITLVGPCKSKMHFEIEGTVEADENPGALPEKTKEWITINYINDLMMSGGGVFDGKGQQAWKQNDCHKNKNCVRLPMNLSFNFVKNVEIKGLTTKDSKNFHVNCISSQNVTFKEFTVSAPSDDIAPNTDGLHIARVTNVKVLDSVIKTGDDCVSIGDETNGLLIQNVTCGPGHGISIGSLGKFASEKDVENVIVRDCSFTGTQNGVRIKTWPSTPATLTIKDVVFEKLVMNDVSNPIMIDQEYCPHNLCDKTNPSKIQISHLSIRDITGTSATKEAVILACSSGKPCEHVKIGNIDLKYTGKDGPITTKCANVKPNFEGKQVPPVCVGANSEL